MKKKEIARLSTLETVVPELVEACAKDLEFLLSVRRLDSIGSERIVEHGICATRTWVLNSQRYEFGLTPEKHDEDLADAREFIKQPYFDDFCEQFEAYVA